ncbi:hypothetical protein [Salininema proteolyticum]
MSPQTRLALRRGGRRTGPHRMPLVRTHIADRVRAEEIMVRQRALAVRIAMTLFSVIAMLVASVALLPAPWSYLVLLTVPYPLLLLLSHKGVRSAEAVDEAGKSP